MAEFAPFTFTYSEDAYTALEDAGFSVLLLDDQWCCTDPLGAEAFLASTAPLALIRARKIAAIKQRASEHILARYPITKQLNMNMRATELTDVRVGNGGNGNGRNLTTEEEAEAVALRTAATWIKSVRIYSDQLEAQVNDPLKTWQDVAAIDIKAGWPA